MKSINVRVTFTICFVIFFKPPFKKDHLFCVMPISKDVSYSKVDDADLLKFHQQNLCFLYGNVDDDTRVLTMGTKSMKL